jgi:two-component system alkaline phosphatase synthesis response regulator PhoP
MATVLVVDDNARIVSILAACLGAEGHEVISAANGVSAIALAVSGKPDIALVDVMLPDIGGLELTRVFRNQAIPTIIISARTTEDDRIAGLEVGADDYITKPFSTREVMARVRIALRHAERARSTRKEEFANGLVSAGDFSIDAPGRVARYDGKVLELTRTEFDILLMLAESPGRALSRETLAGALHGGHVEGSARVVDSHVKNLRQALGGVARDRVVSVYGVGYKLDV